MHRGISVVICCYNSVARITPTLTHLLLQENIAVTSWEVILVDNGSTDNTAEKAKQVWDDVSREKPAFKVINESIPGLSAARLRGINEACFDYVLFCDDDNWLASNYLCISLDMMKANPLIGALGGTGSPVFEQEEPPYFWINQFHALAVGSQSDVEYDITDGRGVLYGAGLVLNKPAFKILQEKFNFRFQLTDRTRNNLASSGDHELCLALKRIGYRIFYLRTLEFRHYLPHYRTTITFYKKLFLGFGESYALLHVYRMNKKDLYYFKNDYRYSCLRCVKNIVMMRIALLLNGYHLDSNKYKYVGQLYELYNNIGMFKTFLRVRNLYQQQFNKLALFKSD